MKPVIVRIDLDQKCKKCGNPGAVGKTDLCMKCIADRIAKLR